MRIGTTDLDAGLFSMQKGGDTVYGTAAEARYKECLGRGVMIGGDPEGRDKAPLEVARFPRSAFGMTD